MLDVKEVGIAREFHSAIGIKMLLQLFNDRDKCDRVILNEQSVLVLSIM